MRRIPGKIAIIVILVVLTILVLSIQLLSQEKEEETKEISGESSIRIKDLVNIQGVDENQLRGLGLVIGLNGTGDSPKMVSTTILSTVLNKLEDIRVNPKDINSKNIAVVIVTANIGPFQEPGTWIDVTISSIGDAKSLKGGTLLTTPLRGPWASSSSDVYAVAQGPVIVNSTDNPTVGTIPQGARVEKSIPQNFIKKIAISDDYNNKKQPQSLTEVFKAILGDKQVKNVRDTTVERDKNIQVKIEKYVELNLKKPDFNMAVNIASLINAKVASLGVEFLDGIAEPINAGTIRLMLGDLEDTKIVRLISRIFELKVAIFEASMPEASVVISERTGSYVISGNVLVLPVRARAGRTVISVPDRLSGKSAQAVPLRLLIQGLEKTGAPTEDIINIIKNLNASKSLIGRVIVK